MVAPPPTHAPVPPYKHKVVNDLIRTQMRLLSFMAVMASEESSLAWLCISMSSGGVGRPDGSKKGIRTRCSVFFIDFVSELGWVLAAAVPDPGAGSPATQARCRMPGPVPDAGCRAGRFSVSSPRKPSKNHTTNPRNQKKIEKINFKKTLKNDNCYHFCRGRPALKNSFFEPNEPGYEL